MNHEQERQDKEHNYMNVILSISRYTAPVSLGICAIALLTYIAARIIAEATIETNPDLSLFLTQTIRKMEEGIGYRIVVLLIGILMVKEMVGIIYGMLVRKIRAYHEAKGEALGQARGKIKGRAEHRAEWEAWIEQLPPEVRESLPNTRPGQEDD